MSNKELNVELLAKTCYIFKKDLFYNKTIGYYFLNIYKSIPKKLDTIKNIEKILHFACFSNKVYKNMYKFMLDNNIEININKIFNHVNDLFITYIKSINIKILSNAINTYIIQFTYKDKGILIKNLNSILQLLCKILIKNELFFVYIKNDIIKRLIKSDFKYSTKEIHLFDLETILKHPHLHWLFGL